MTGKKIHGGTTISGTMILSELAGIKIFGTGGLGKAHGQRDTKLSPDQSFRRCPPRRGELYGYFWYVCWLNSMPCND
jgi:hypothetical protein